MFPLLESRLPIVEAVNADRNITLSDRGKVLYVKGGVTLSMPESTVFPRGFGFFLVGQDATTFTLQTSGTGAGNVYNTQGGINVTTAVVLGGYKGWAGSVMCLETGPKNWLVFAAGGGQVSMVTSEVQFWDELGAAAGDLSAYKQGAQLYMILGMGDGQVNAGGVFWTSGSGSPETVLAADKGSLYTDKLTGTLYRKTTNTVATGWVTP